MTKEEKYLLVLFEIYNHCIGEITMGHKLDANAIGELIHNQTGYNINEMADAIQSIKNEQ